MGDILGDFSGGILNTAQDKSKSDGINFADYVDMPTSDVMIDSEPGVMDKIEGGARALNRGIMKAPIGVMDFAATLGSSLAGTDITQDKLFQGARAYEGFVNDFQKSNKALSPMTENIIEGLGQIGGQVIAAGMTGGESLVGQALKPVAGMSIAGMGTTQGIQDAQQSGASPEDIKTAAAWGTVGGLTEFLPVEKILGIADKAAPGLKAKAMNILATGGIEGLQEWAQQLGTNLTAKLTYDQERELNEGLEQSAQMGGATGIIASTIATMFGIKPRGLFNNNSSETVYDATVMPTEALPAPTKRTIEKAIDAEWSQVISQEPKQLPGQPQLEEPVYNAEEIGILVPTGTSEQDIVSGDILQKIEAKYGDSPVRKQYALDYVKKKQREITQNILPTGEQIDLPEESLSLVKPVNITTEEAEINTLQEMLTDPKTSAEDKQFLQQRLDELQGNQTIERRLNDSQRKVINDLIEAKDIDGIAKLIYHDDLTGLMNKRSWDEAERLASMVGAHVGSLDLAGVKYINDTFGHAAGDEMFKLLGGELKDSGTLLFRKGGDEFAAVFEKGQDPNKILSKLREKVGKLKVTLTDKQGKKLTFSGWSLDYGTGEDFESADAQLYTRRADAEASGKRNPIRGEKPYGLVAEELSTGDEDQLRDAEVEKLQVQKPKGYEDETADDTLQFYMDLVEENSFSTKVNKPVQVKATGNFTKAGDIWIASTEGDQLIAIRKEGKKYLGYVGTPEEVQLGTAEVVGSYPSLPKARKALSESVETTPIEPITKVDLKERLELLKKANEEVRQKKIQELVDDDTFDQDQAEDFVSWESAAEDEAYQDLYEDQYEERDFADIAKDLYTIFGDERGAINPKDSPEVRAAKKRLNNDVKRLLKLAKRFTVKLFHYPGLVTDHRGEVQKVYHGTIKAFDKHSGEKLGAYTGAPSAKLGHFFAGRPETANVYTEPEEDPDYKTWEELVHDTEVKANFPDEAMYIYKNSLEPFKKRLRNTYFTQSDKLRSVANPMFKAYPNSITRELLKTSNILMDNVLYYAESSLKDPKTSKNVHEYFLQHSNYKMLNEQNVQDLLKPIEEYTYQADVIIKEFKSKWNQRNTDPEMIEEFNKYITKTHKNYNYDLYEQVRKEVLKGDSLRKGYKDYLQSTIQEFKQYGIDFSEKYNYLAALAMDKNTIWKLLREVDKGYAGGQEPLRAGKFIREAIIERLPPEERELVLRDLRRLSNNYDVAEENLHNHEAQLYTQLNKSQVELVDELIKKSPHAPNIRVANLIMHRPFTYDMKGKQYRERTYYDIIKEAWTNGHDGVIIKNTYDGGPLDNIYIVKKTEQIVPAFEHEAEVIQNLWERLGKYLSNERGSVDMRGAYGLAAELGRQIRRFINSIKKHALKLHLWIEQGRRAAANRKITDQQQHKDSNIAKHYMESVTHAYKTDLKGVIKQYYDHMVETDRIVPKYKKGQKTPPKRQQPWITKQAPGMKPGAEGYSIGWLKRNFRTPSGMFRNIFEVDNNPSVEMAESQMAFINNTANDLAWYKDVVGKISNNSPEIRARLDVIYEEYNKLRQAADRESRKIQGWTEQLRAAQDPARIAELKKKIKSGNKRVKGKIARLNEGLKVAFDSEFVNMCEEFSDIRITAQVMEELPSHVKLTAQELDVANYVKDYFRRTKDDMVKKGLPVKNTGPYIHHIIPMILNDPDSQAFARRNNLPASLKFLHQSEDSRPWYPSIHDILQSYIPMVNKKLAHEEFLQKWQPAIAAMPTDIHRYMTDWVEENLFRKPYTPFERAVNHLVEFEYIRLTALSLSIPFKHGTKMVDSLMRYDVMTNAKAGKVVIESMAHKLANSLGVKLEGDNTSFEMMKAFVNMNTMLQMTTEMPNTTLVGNYLKRVAGAGVNIVEFLDNGVTVFSTMMAAHNAEMSVEQASKIIWDTMLAANFRGGHDMPFVYKKPYARPFMMFQSTVQKLWGYRGSILKGAINGEKDAFGTSMGTMLIRMLLMFGLAEGFMRDWFKSSLVDQALHTPYISHFVQADKGGYSLHEPKVAGSPVIDLAYNMAKKGIVTGVKDEFSYWGEMTKLYNSMYKGKYPKNYYRSHVLYHLGIQKVHSNRGVSSKKQSVGQRRSVRR